MADDRKPKEPQGLPEGWKWVRLGELCKITTGEKDVNEGNPEGEYYFFTCSRIPTRSDNYSFDAEAILIAGNGEVGTIHYYNGKFEAYQRTYVLVEFVSVDVKYIYYYLSKFLTKHLNIEKIGTTIQYIKFGDLYNFFIYLPEKEFEQRKIAQILETVDNAIEKTEKIIEKYKRIKQGLMQDLLTKGIDEKGNIRSEKTHKFKDSPLGRIPEEWEVVRLGEVAFITSSKRIYYNEYLTEGVPFFRSKEIIELSTGSFSGATLYISHDKFKYIANKFGVPEAGDILITAVGTLGIVYLVKQEDLPFYFKDGNLLWIKLEENLNKLYFVKSFSSWFNIQKDNLTIGTSQSALTIEKLKEMLIPLPPLSEQKRIAEILSQIDQTIEKEEKYKQKLERLKKGLMEDLLTGKVRVNKLLEGEVNEMA